jgi:hypothetical protein
VNLWPWRWAVWTLALELGALVGAVAVALLR